MPESSVDVVTLIFVLSAVHPDKMKLALENIRKVNRDSRAKWIIVESVEGVDKFERKKYMCKYMDV